jgi:hypothetical protein
MKIQFTRVSTNELVEYRLCDDYGLSALYDKDNTIQTSPQDFAFIYLQSCFLPQPTNYKDFVVVEPPAEKIVVEVDIRIGNYTNGRDDIRKLVVEFMPDGKVTHRDRFECTFRYSKADQHNPYNCLRDTYNCFTKESSTIK